MRTINIQRNDYLVYLFSFLFPFFGLICSLVYWRKNWAKNVFWIACMFMGAIQIFHPEGTILGIGIDGSDYALRFINMYDMKVSWASLVKTFFEDGETLDIYQPLLSFFISRFTNNAHVLFFFFALVFGFFYSRNIWYVLGKLPNKSQGWTWVLIAFFILICPIWNINGVRMWTALQVFVYGAMPFIFEKDKSKLYWCFLTILIHFSFILPVVILILYFFLPKKNISIYLIFYLSTLLIKQIDLSFVKDSLLSLFPDFYDNRINMYTNEDYALSVNKSAFEMTYFLILCSTITNWIIQIYVVVSCYLINNYLNNNLLIKRLCVFSLLIYGISNIFALVPSGGRFITLSQMFMIPLFIFVINLSPHIPYLLRKLHPILMVILIIPLAQKLRGGFDFYGISLFVCNFLTMFFVESDVPLIRYVKELL